MNGCERDVSASPISLCMVFVSEKILEALGLSDRALLLGFLPKVEDIGGRPRLLSVDDAPPNVNCRRRFEPRKRKLRSGPLDGGLKSNRPSFSSVARALLGVECNGGRDAGVRNSDASGDGIIDKG